MRVAVIGSGAIGGLVAGYLGLKGHYVSLIAHQESVKAIRENGLNISGARGSFYLKPEISEKLDFKPSLAILAVKTPDIESVFAKNGICLSESLLVTVQNGVRSDEIVARFMPEENIISSIAMFGATLVEPGKVVHNFEGDWIIGKPFGINDGRVYAVKYVLNSVFHTVVSDSIRGMKYAKIFVNANNCIPAILGVSMQEAFADLRISAIAIAIWREGLRIMNSAGIKMVSLPDFPLERLHGMCEMPPEEAAKICSGIMQGLSKEPIYGSVLQSIKRGRPSEIDYLNGEFVRIAQERRLEAPLNKKLVELVHQVEKTAQFLTPDEFLAAVKEFLV